MTSLNPSLRLALINKAKAQKNILQRGFTLVELMVVIVVVGVLSAVALPNLLSNREIASRNASQNVLSTVAKACTAAISSNDKLLDPTLNANAVPDVTFATAGTQSCAGTTANVVLTATAPASYGKWVAADVCTATISKGGDITYSWTTNAGKPADGKSC